MAYFKLGTLPLNGKSIITEFGDLGGSLGLTDEYWFERFRWEFGTNR